MPEKFHYSLRQRLLVPGQAETTGVVMRRTESVDEDPNYHLRWLSATGRQQSGWFSQADVQAANGGQLIEGLKMRERRASAGATSARGKRVRKTKR
jgi:hypothetical protein